MQMALPGLDFLEGREAEAPEAIFRRVFEEVRPRTEVPAIAVEYRRFANGSSRIELRQGRIRARLSDVLAAAPAAVLESLAHILLCKLYRRPVDPERSRAYRLHMDRKETRQSIDAARRLRGRKEMAGESGEVYDLGAIFERVNGRYFGGTLRVKKLGWSKRRSRQTLGHYDASHDAIVLSRVLDAPEVPEMVVEYVMYHEMLHAKHPAEHKGGRRSVHTKAFRAEEKEFAGYAEARGLLKKLAFSGLL